MFKKKTIFLVALVFLVTSCANTFDSAKRGLTGAKRKSTDEFFIQKKDPLVLPPDFENLPSPSDREEAQEEAFGLEKKLIKEIFLFNIYCFLIRFSIDSSAELPVEVEVI